jgi:hypothetical protein
MAKRDRSQESLIKCIVPMPMRPLVPTIMYEKSDGLGSYFFDREAYHAAKIREYERFLVTLKECHERLVAEGKTDSVVNDMYGEEDRYVRGLLEEWKAETVVNDPPLQEDIEAKLSEALVELKVEWDLKWADHD